jgi:hypothetical protein
VFGNRVLRGIFVSKSGESIVEWRKMHSKELHNFSSPILLELLYQKGDDQGLYYEEVRRRYKIQIVQTQGKRQLDRPRLRWQKY